MEEQGSAADDEDGLKEVVTIESEASILQRASEEIKRIVECKLKQSGTSSNKQTSDGDKALSEPVTDENDVRTKLQNQVKTGEITPFQAVKKENASKQILGRTLKESTQLLDLEKYIIRQAELAKQKKLLKKKKRLENEKGESQVPAKKIKLMNKESKTNATGESKVSNKNHPDKKVCNPNEPSESSSSKKAIDTLENFVVEDTDHDIDNDSNQTNQISKKVNSRGSKKSSKRNQALESKEYDDESGSEYVPSDEYDSDVEENERPRQKKKSNKSKQIDSRPKRVLDDGDEDMYLERVEASGYKKSEPLHKVDNVFKVPLRIWKHLYKYQRVAVKWLWELHNRNLGGLLGDEMGLGKTVQVIAFLSGLDCSELLSDGGRFRGLGPTLIICPATLLEQWVQHFHDWWPVLRIVMLHQSSTYQGDIEELLHSLKVGGILVTTYTSVLIHKESILKYKWHYVILDEGHKIRNPEAKVSKAVKLVLTPHRLLLTGSPMQNSLKELWSLFDFILPGKLGTLPAFMEHCAGPITKGGYANASRLQEATALQVATMLKNAITPYMLRRTKLDVQHHVNLPDKNEQVLFCSLTEEQRELYKYFLTTDEVSYVLHERREGGRYKARLLVALTALRKICNHPDLYLYTDAQADYEAEADLDMEDNEAEKIGHWKRAGKMTVVRSLLKIWKKQGHRVLLFTQSRQMMHILEGLLQKEKYTYMRMDGTTPMSQRQVSISRFNEDPSYFVFLLTTRVGGLGVNLTGADRVIIYDPDWNPATDAQARERAWRIGQDKNVTVYRLITAGTIEEKMYHRQIYKILLSNRVLEDPRQRRLFHTSDLAELFNLNEPINGASSESDRLFRDSKLSPNHPNFSSSKIEAMKRLASTISKKIGEKAKSNESNNTNTAEESSEKISEKNNAANENEPSDSTSAIKDGSTIETSGHSENDAPDEVLTNLDDNAPNVGFKDSNNEQKTDQIVIDAKDVESAKRPESEDNPHTSTSLDNKNTGKGEIVDVQPKPASTSLTDDEGPNKCNDVPERKSRKKHKKHKKKKKSHDSVPEISAMFEGERVSCLIGRRIGQAQEPDPVASSDDHYVLSKLFSKAAVSSAFQHESVLSNAVLHPDEETPLQRAAKETASERMERIRQSRKWCWKPDWEKRAAKSTDIVEGKERPDYRLVRFFENFILKKNKNVDNLTLKLVPV
ncbi:hypothetical protein QAD02_000304 [Eretmocerus hayati]|uniref:Uncharacterized protein n=1 Tax=Eretmocerus hayati TaxID=131215 RepID=A0ACC2NHK5_9HYME|nr:hypothetical protein QAD02_000304 [Eretmocerus hayati]